LYAAARREEAKQDHVAEDMKQVASHNEGQLTDTKLSAEQLEELVKTPAGVISPRRANMRADLGNGEPQPPEVCSKATAVHCAAVWAHTVCCDGTIV